MLFSILRKLLILSVSICVGLSLVSCGSNKKGSYGSKNSRMSTMAATDAMDFYGENISYAEEEELQNERTLYFGFDQFTITAQNRMILLAHAKKLLNNPKLRLRIEGHADERGSREYNIALGERRANAAKRILAMKGVDADQIAVVSYGKEKPAVFGSDETTWELNRRDELVYENRS